MRKRSLFLVVGASLATLALTVGSAVADPTAPTGPRDLAGTGSDTTQGVMDALSNVVTISGNKVIASYDVTGANPITTKGTAGSAPCTFNRPVGSGAGTDALHNSLVAGDGCLQFARSSNNDSASRSGQGLTYVPFATDGIAYAQLGSSNNSRSLSKALLQKIFTCDSTTTTNFHPYLPQSNSGTRKFFMETYLGVPNPEPPASCIKEVDKNGNLLVENTGNLLVNDPKLIVPYSISSYIAQLNKAPGGLGQDVHGNAVLGSIDGVSPTLLNTSSGAGRAVYNVIPTNQVGTGSETDQVFDSNTSPPTTALICQNQATITGMGFATNPNCGSTAIQTP
jgi:hypothetical protein